MFIRDLIRDSEPSISFEFFPPKTDAGEDKLLGVIRDELAPLNPTFVSCTYGAGGSSRDRTLRVVERIASETDVTPMAHLTIVGHRPGELEAIVSDLAAAGIENILALGGDPPADDDAFVQPEDAFEHAIELVRLVHAHASGDFSVGCAGFPEVHPAAPDMETDVGHMIDKVKAGVDFILTQFFFEADHYWRFVETAERMGKPDEVPIIPGIMPVTNIKQITRMAELSGADFPPWLAEKLEAAGDDADAMAAVGIAEATKLCGELLDAGAPGLHFYTLNKSPATRQIYSNLDL